MNENDLTNGFEEALDTLCSLCKQVNPQHDDCNSCDEVDEYRKVIEEAKLKII